jgi:Resolvase, N terminal domain
MSRSELVTPDHLTRKAIIYIRPSTPPQVLTNHESLHLPYALRQRALQLGWRDDDSDVIDTDLGLTAVEASHRAGFKELVTRVTLGQVGIILSIAVTRLSRNLTDWYPLLDICGFKSCLIADRDGVGPRHPERQIITGLKRHVVRDGDAHHPRASDDRPAQQGRTRRTGPRVTHGSDARSVRAGP